MAEPETGTPVLRSRHPFSLYSRTSAACLIRTGIGTSIFAHPGVRTLPIPAEEISGKTGAAPLYAYLRRNGGISMPHSTATSQGTDWRDNDPEVEPLMEIYQGYSNSYEYEGAPRAATAGNPQAQKSGWEPKGFCGTRWPKVTNSACRPAPTTGRRTSPMPA